VEVRDRASGEIVPTPVDQVVDRVAALLSE
jgi:hypothetical protein